jgi:hypothetical protein
MLSKSHEREHTFVMQVKARTAHIGLGPTEHAKKIPLPNDLLQLVKKATGPDLNSKKGAVSTMFVDDLVGTLEKAVKSYAEARVGFDLEPDLAGDPFLEYVCGLQAFSPQQLSLFLDLAFTRYGQKATEPSTPIGAIAAQVRMLLTVALSCQGECFRLAKKKSDSIFPEEGPF